MVLFCFSCKNFLNSSLQYYCKENQRLLCFLCRAKHIKAFRNVACLQDICTKKHDSYLNIEEIRERILVKV